MAKVPNGVETVPKISIAYVRRTNITDRQTTDRRTTTYSEREFTFAKNYILDLGSAIFDVIFNVFCVFYILR